jgi:hypothetical protein
MADESTAVSTAVSATPKPSGSTVSTRHQELYYLSRVGRQGSERCVPRNRQGPSGSASLYWRSQRTTAETAQGRRAAGRMGRVYAKARLLEERRRLQARRLKYADGTDVDEASRISFASKRRNFSFRRPRLPSLPKSIKHNESGTAAKTADETAAATKALEQLRQSWGPNYEANKVIADNAYAAMMAAAGFDQPR